MVEQNTCLNPIFFNLTRFQSFHRVYFMRLYLCLLERHVYSNSMHLKVKKIPKKRTYKICLVDKAYVKGRIGRLLRLTLLK